MEEYNLQEIRIEDYNSIKEYYQMRRPETADSNILDLYIWLNCYPTCLLYTSPSPRDAHESRMPSSA